MKSIQTLSVRFKILLVVVLGIVLLTLAGYFFSTFVLLKSYEAIERQDAQENVERAYDAIQEAVSQLDVKLTDWASWDDAYAFIDDKNKDFIASNLGVSSLANLKINSMVYVNTKREVTFIRNINYVTKAELPSQSFSDYVSSHTRLAVPANETSTVTGLASLPDGVFMVASRPILKSDGTGPVRGALVFGKALNSDMVTTLSGITHLDIALYPYGLDALPKDVEQAKTLLSEHTPYVIQPLSGSTIAGYRILYDIDNKPVLILRVNTPRTIYTQGLNTFGAFRIFGVVSLLLLGIVIMTLLESLVISRLAKLGSEVNIIRDKKDLSLRVRESGTDEVGRLAAAINQMLVQIFTSQQREREANEQARAALEKEQASIEELKKLNSFMVDRELKMSELKKEVETLKSKSSS